MAEIYIGLKITGTDIDIADFEGFLKSTKSLDLTSLFALWSRLTSVTFTEVKVVPQTVNTIVEEIIYPKP